MSSARLLAPMMLLALAACGGSEPPVAAPESPTIPTPIPPAPTGAHSLKRAHAHNDYEHTRPLLDALDQGFTSVEADVYTLPIPSIGLYVAHDPQDIQPQRTLAALYLEPLKARAAENGGCIQPDCAPFYLLIDAKTEAESTWTQSKPSWRGTARCSRATRTAVYAPVR